MSDSDSDSSAISSSYLINGKTPGSEQPFGHSSLQANTYDWVNALICDKLRYPKPRQWQVECALQLLKGRDVFAIIKTGGGKSTILHVVLLGAQIRALLELMDAGQTGRKANAGLTLGVLVVPTKVLADKQVCHDKRRLGIY